ncbi:EscU/YscU/HrcU family type III secretion system export apparatus switch protein [Neptunicella sp.]|uniref:EscU/YscU/HrcU family type III secretion system export apparatus switch protein n=1 Tax=Neptunicella sp. TaxID=2125986 RepID=UPI003F693D33
MKSEDNKTRKAIGLKYQPGDAPEVIAKGFGDLADEIIQLAKQSGVLIHEDQHLSDFLGRLDLGQQIPEELYHVIAELIAFSYVLQGKFPEGWQHAPGQFKATT